MSEASETIWVDDERSIGGSARATLTGDTFVCAGKVSLRDCARNSCVFYRHTPHSKFSVMSRALHNLHCCCGQVRKHGWRCIFSAGNPVASRV